VGQANTNTNKQTYVKINLYISYLQHHI
jgi:hypothetical protein